MAHEELDPDAVEFGPRRRGPTQWAPVAVVGVLLVVAGYLAGRASAPPDVSTDGQIAYGCALAQQVRDSHRTADAWGAIGEDPAYVQMSAIRTLLGAGQIRSDAEEYDPFAEINWTLGDLADWGNQLDATIAACDRR